MGIVITQLDEAKPHDSFGQQHFSWPAELPFALHLYLPKGTILDNTSKRLNVFGFPALSTREWIILGRSLSGPDAILFVADGRLAVKAQQVGFGELEPQCHRSGVLVLVLHEPSDCFERIVTAIGQGGPHYILDMYAEGDSCESPGCCDFASKRGPSALSLQDALTYTQATYGDGRVYALGELAFEREPSPLQCERFRILFSPNSRLLNYYRRCASLEECVYSILVFRGTLDELEVLAELCDRICLPDDIIFAVMGTLT